MMLERFRMLIVEAATATGRDQAMYRYIELQQALAEQAWRGSVESHGHMGNSNGKLVMN